MDTSLGLTQTLKIKINLNEPDLWAMYIRIRPSCENNFFLKFSDIYPSFQNDICQGTGDIDGRSGVCWTKEECAALKGIADGGCASGYGVCCICKCKFLTNVCLVFQF